MEAGRATAISNGHNSMSTTPTTLVWCSFKDVGNSVTQTAKKVNDFSYLMSPPMMDRWRYVPVTCSSSSDCITRDDSRADLPIISQTICK